MLCRQAVRSVSRSVPSLGGCVQSSLFSRPQRLIHSSIALRQEPDLESTKKHEAEIEAFLKPLGMEDKAENFDTWAHLMFTKSRSLKHQMDFTVKERKKLRRAVLKWRRICRMKEKFRCLTEEEADLYKYTQDNAPIKDRTVPEGEQREFKITRKLVNQRYRAMRIALPRQWYGRKKNQKHAGGFQEYHEKTQGNWNWTELPGNMVNKSQFDVADDSDDEYDFAMRPWESLFTDDEGDDPHMPSKEDGEDGDEEDKPKKKKKTYKELRPDIAKWLDGEGTKIWEEYQRDQDAIYRMKNEAMPKIMGGEADLIDLPGDPEEEEEEVAADDYDSYSEPSGDEDETDDDCSKLYEDDEDDDDDEDKEWESEDFFDPNDPDNRR